VDFRFKTEVRVRFAETDAQGIAHNSVYLVWFELARIDYLARFRGGYPGLRADGIEALTIEAQVRYLAPARFDDRLTIRARCGESARCALPLRLLGRARRRRGSRRLDTARVRRRDVRTGRSGCRRGSRTRSLR
jgi:YbgC/YbaW family acyl-CoA thioester hydrolase